MDAERKSGCGSFVRKVILLAILTVLAAKVVHRLYPELLPRLKERMMSCCGCRGGGCCGTAVTPAAEAAPDEAATEPPTPETAPGE
jgi:hypothetical protein